jgi:hypothetical protein
MAGAAPAGLGRALQHTVRVRCPAAAQDVAVASALSNEVRAPPRPAAAGRDGLARTRLAGRASDAARRARFGLGQFRPAAGGAAGLSPLLRRVSRSLRRTPRARCVTLCRGRHAARRTQPRPARPPAVCTNRMSTVAVP